MTINRKEEAMGGQKISLLQILLRAALGVLVCTSSGAIYGCGSNENPPLVRQDKKPAISGKPQVKEILPGSNSGAALPLQPVVGRPAGQPVPEAAEVIPPDQPGGRGLTAAEVTAITAGAKPLDPELIEVIPPDRPGGRGLTASEVMAKTAARSPHDPNFSHMIPPPNPGARSGKGGN
jgi:hypothetical protein